MNIEIIKISELTPPKRNAKIHTSGQIEHIQKSIEKYGFNDAVGIWGDKNIIVTGNGRVEALKKMGISEVACVRLDHLTDGERREYVRASGCGACCTGVLREQASPALVRVRRQPSLF